MNARELSKYNVGENLDQLMNLDPRGYGVCRILYPAARKAMGSSLCMKTAETLHAILSQDKRPKSEKAPVYIMTGFVLKEHECPETDGITGALLLARALVVAYGVTPVFVIPKKCVPAITAAAPHLGLHAYADLEKAKSVSLSLAYMTISEDVQEAAAETEVILEMPKPAALFCTESAGANAKGVYHNAVGADITSLEAKSDALFNALKKAGVSTFAVGDLGNEMGMGLIKRHVEKYIPNGKEIIAATSADYLVTATVSDWGVYAVIAALAYLNGKIEIMHDEQMEEAVLRACCLSGMVDMTGSLLPAIDGFSVDIEKQIVALMRSTVEYAIAYPQNKWFDGVLEKGFYGKC